MHTTYCILRSYCVCVYHVTDGTDTKKGTAAVESQVIPVYHETTAFESQVVPVYHETAAV